jgi:hypothetical protein
MSLCEEESDDDHHDDRDHEDVDVNVSDNDDEMKVEVSVVMGDDDEVALALSEGVVENKQEQEQELELKLELEQKSEPVPTPIETKVVSPKRRPNLSFPLKPLSRGATSAPKPKPKPRHVAAKPVAAVHKVRKENKVAAPCMVKKRSAGAPLVPRMTKAQQLRAEAIDKRKRDMDQVLKQSCQQASSLLQNRKMSFGCARPCATAKFTTMARVKRAERAVPDATAKPFKARQCPNFHHMNGITKSTSRHKVGMEIVNKGRFAATSTDTKENSKSPVLVNVNTRRR